MKLISCPHCGSNRLRFYNGWAFGKRTQEANKHVGERTPTICCVGCDTCFDLGVFGGVFPDTVVRKKLYDAWNVRTAS